jgi:hypothetical protein
MSMITSTYNDDNKYIELPWAMEHAFRAAIDARAVASNAGPSRTATPWAARTLLGACEAATWVQSHRL